MCHLGTMHVCTQFHGNSSKGCQDISLDAKMSTWRWMEKKQSHVDWCVCSEFHANPSSPKEEMFQSGPLRWMGAKVMR